MTYMIWLSNFGLSDKYLFYLHNFNEYAIYIYINFALNDYSWCYTNKFVDN